jgi:DnaJ-domain-containing protein 1
VGIFDRLGNVIKSYLNQEDERIFGSSRSRGGDPFMAEAEAELERFLRRGGSEPWTESRGSGDRGNQQAGGNRGAGQRPGSGGRTTGETGRADRAGGPERETPPERLRPDFAELELPLGAGPEECKAAYKRLLKLHHPDRHAGHAGNTRRATEKSARINAAYDRIARWREGKWEP